MKFRLKDREIKFISASVRRTLNTGADEFNFVVEWRPGVDKEFDQLIKPRSLSDVEISIRGEKLISGYKYTTSPIFTTGGNSVQLGGYSKTYPLIMSNPKVQKEFLNSSLRDIAKEYCDVIGILIKSQNVDTEIDEKFENVKINAQTQIFTFLQDLARQRGVLTSSDENGNLLFLKPNIKQQTIGSIIEGEGAKIPKTDRLNATFDDTKIFQTYLAINDSPFSFLLKDPGGIIKDTRIKVPSFKTVTMNSLIEGAAQRAVEFTKNQIIAQSLSIPLEVNGWNAPNGQLWREGKLVSLVSPTLFVENGYTFLIVSVEYNSDSRGETAILELSPPQLFTGEEIEEPW